MDLQEAYQEWQTKQDESSLGQVLQAARPTIDSAMKSYAKTTYDPVIRLRAMRLANKAIKSYDPEKGAKLKTHLMNQLKPLYRYSFERKKSLKLPQRTWYDFQNMREEEERFRRENDRDPSAAELADATGLSMRRIEYIKGLKRTGVTESMLREKDVESYFEPTEPEASSYWAEAVYRSLPPTDQFIFDHRLGAHGEEQLSNNEIAKQLGISASAVSQRVGRITEMLQEERSG